LTRRRPWRPRPVPAPGAAKTWRCLLHASGRVGSVRGSVRPAGWPTADRPMFPKARPAAGRGNCPGPWSGRRQQSSASVGSPWTLPQLTGAEANRATGHRGGLPEPQGRRVARNYGSGRRPSTWAVTGGSDCHGSRRHGRRRLRRHPRMSLATLRQTGGLVGDGFMVFQRRFSARSSRGPVPHPGGVFGDVAALFFVFAAGSINRSSTNSSGPALYPRPTWGQLRPADIVAQVQRSFSRQGK